MASIETLIAQIDDLALRDKLSKEVVEMKKRLDWGLVFERHLPENVRALAAPIKPGSVVWERRAAPPRRLRVRAIEGPELVVVAEPEKTTAPADAPTERIARTDVLVEQDFAEPVFPVPTPLGAVRNGAPDAPYHAVIQGENYHAIQALLAAYDRSFDLIYLDPPYNTGNRDWSYNNDYVDPNDTYRPSRWLAFMERRLRVARRLLKSDGVIVVTIDENEVHRLGMLLEQLFPAALHHDTLAVAPAPQDPWVGRDRTAAAVDATGLAQRQQPALLAGDLVVTGELAVGQHREHTVRSTLDGTAGDRPELAQGAFEGDPGRVGVGLVGQVERDGDPDNEHPKNRKATDHLPCAA